MLSLALKSQSPRADGSLRFSSEATLMSRKPHRRSAVAGGRGAFNAPYYHRSDRSNLLSLVFNFPADPVLEANAEKAWRLSGGALFEVRSVAQAMLAEFSGAHGVFAAPRGIRVPLRFADGRLIREIERHISIPVMTVPRARLGEATTLQQTGSKFINKSEVVNVADEDLFLKERELRVPCVGSCTNLGQAMSRVGEGAAMIRIVGDFWGPVDLSKTLKNVRSVLCEMRALIAMEEDADTLFAYSERIEAPLDVVLQTKRMGWLPVPLFAEGGITTANDAELLIRSGCDGVIVDSEIFNCTDPFLEMKTIAAALNHHRDK